MTQPPGPGPDDEPPAPYGRPPTFGPPGRHAQGYQPPAGPPPGYYGGYSGPPPGYSGPPPGYYGPGYYGPPGFPPPYYPPYSAPRPGCVPLRPLGLGDILDGAFKVIRRNPKVTLGLSAVFALFEVLISTGLSFLTFHTLSRINDNDTNIDITPILGNDALQLVGLLVTTLVGALLTGALTHVVTQDVLGRRLSAGEVWRRVVPRAWAFIGLALVTGVLEFLGLIPCLVLGVWLWGIWAVAMPACAVEGIGIRAALGRSRRLVEGTFWRVWGIRALGTLVASLTANLIGLPFTIFGVIGLLEGISNHDVPTGALLLVGLGTLIGRTFTAPVQAGVDALLYVDLRMRKEGLDIALQQAALAPPAAPAAGPVAAD